MKTFRRGARAIRSLGYWGILATTASAAGSAHAGGMEYPDLGTVAIGRGTAFVARADNPSAFYYNPAGLSKQKRGHVLVGANLVNLNVHYLRAGTGGRVTLGTYDWGPNEVENPGQDWSDGPLAGKPFTEVSQTGLGPAPMIVASWGGIGKAEGLAISIGVIPPSSFGGHDYDAEGPQRYNLVKTNNMILYPGVGLSYAVNRYFQVGVVFLSGIGLVDISRASRPVPQIGLPHKNEDLFNDAAFRIEAKDFFMPTGIIGVLSNPLDWLEVGASVRLPVRMEATGEFSYGAPAANPDYVLVDDPNSLLLSQTMPTILRVGGRYIHEWFDVEVDVVYENWKTLDYVELEADAALDKGDGSAPTELPNVQLPRKYRDTFSVRLGGDVNAIPDKLAVRAGAFYQSSAYPKNYETFSLDFPYGEQVGVGAGLSWHVIEHLSLNIGYSHIFQRDVLVTQGIVQQTGLPYEPGDGNQYNIGNTINNGSYEVNINLAGLSAEGKF